MITSGARIVAALVLLGLVGAGPVPTRVAQAAPQPSATASPAGPDPAVVAAREALDHAVARQRLALHARVAAQSAAAGADASVRAIEAELVVDVLDRRDRERAARAAAVAARQAVAEHAAVVEEVAAAREDLATRAREAYMYGSSTARMGGHVLEMLGELSSPLEIGRGLYQLEAVVGDGQRTLHELEVAEAQAAVRVRETAAAAERARQDLEAAGARVDDTEDRAAQARATADAAEEVLLARAEALLDAEQALERAHDRLAAARASARRGSDGSRHERDRPRDADAESDAGVGDLAERGAIARRRSALAHARSLDPARRATRDDLRCPVPGAEFHNDWHFGRPDARRHEGNDLFAPTGTPVRAVTGGRVLRLDPSEGGDLGGITVTYGRPDDRWYAAHLSAIADGLAEGDPVEAGDVVGYVGQTGNARGTPPHLHIGWYVDDVAVNPFASLAVACADDEDELARGKSPGFGTNPPRKGVRQAVAMGMAWWAQDSSGS